MCPAISPTELALRNESPKLAPELLGSLSWIAEGEPLIHLVRVVLPGELVLRLRPIALPSARGARAPALSKVARGVRILDPKIPLSKDPRAKESFTLPKRNGELLLETCRKPIVLKLRLKVADG